MRYKLILLAALAAPTLMADPPARVGRLNLIQGTVSFRAASVDEWAIAQPNRPLTTGDRLWTDESSRAEVHVGSTAIRLSAQTELDFVNVDDNTLQMRLASGTATVRIRSVDDGQVYEIDTPNSAITFGRAGDYRIDVNPDGTMSTVRIWNGGAEVTAAGSAFEVNAQQVASVKGADSPTYDLADIGQPDEWDQWCLSRDHREDASTSVRYVSREMPGYEDLDEYGHWTYIESYGNVWVPDHVGPGWAPYHTGHWVWVDPWGWSWVDDAPWGYAPYHYGRWAYAGGEWFWVPNPNPGPRVVVVAHPVYAPALVAFVGGGGGSVGWVALGVGEPYHPPYAVSETYVRQVNVVNNTTVINNTTIVNNTTVYRNVSAPGAVTAVPQNTMATGAPVSRSAVPMTAQQFASAPAAGTAPPTGVVPQKAAVTGGAASAFNAKAPPAAVENRAVVAKTTPPPAAVPFEQKKEALAQNGGKPLAPAQENQIRQTMPPASHASLVKPASQTTAGAGLRPAREGLANAQPVKNPSYAAASHVPQPPDRSSPATATRVSAPPTEAKPEGHKGNGGHRKAPRPPKEEKKPEKGR
ncbi:MAG TPA: DUF6600 domain-containing protein [Gemmatimonadaceae bacterium]|nr:DUF6600 domain-containing protein [Gemmatimonadaceae bacterium]